MDSPNLFSNSPTTKSSNEVNILQSKKFLLKESVFSILNKYKKVGDKSLYEPILVLLRQNPIPSKLCCHWLGQLKDCIPLLDRSTEPLVIDTLHIPWQYEDEALVSHIHNFIVSLVTAHNYFVGPIIECLLKKMVPDISDENEELLRVNPCNLSENQLAANNRINKLIYSIVIHVPLCHNVLLKTIRHACPYIKKHVHIHVVFVYSMLNLIKVLPNLRRQVFEILLTTIIKLDLHSPRIELEEESDDESDNGSEDLFNMEVDGEDTSNAAIPSTSHPIGHSLDMLMTLFFRYIHLIAHGGSDLSQILGHPSEFIVNGCSAGSSSVALSEDGSKTSKTYTNTTGCGCNGSKHDLEALKSLYMDLKANFTKLILPTHASSHAQFIIFYILALRPSLVSDFLDFLKSVFESPTSGTKEERKSATAYLGSILARGKYVKFSHVHYCLELLNNWCKSYLSSEFVQANKYEDINLHHRFYYACQTVFYVFTFNYKEYTESKARLKLAQSLHLDELVISPLNPLRYCSNAITLNFAAITRHFQLAYCYGILESNSRLFIPVCVQNALGGYEGPSTILDMFFPFDPYLLKRSDLFVREHYNDFEGLPDEILLDASKPTFQDTSNVEMTKSESTDVDDPLFWNSPRSFEMSPGFQSFK